MRKNHRPALAYRIRRGEGIWWRQRGLNRQVTKVPLKLQRAIGNSDAVSLPMWGEDVRIRPLTSLSHSGSQPTAKKSCQAGGGYLERYRPALKFMTMTMFSAATPIKDHAALAPPTDQAEASKIIESNASKVRPTRSPRVWLMGEICEREAAPSPRVVVEVDYVSDAVMGLIMTTDLLALVPAAQRACDSLSTGMSDSSGEDDSLRNSAPRIPTVEGYDGDLTMFSSAKYYMDSYARDSILLARAASSDTCA